MLSCCHPYPGPFMKMRWPLDCIRWRPLWLVGECPSEKHQAWWWYYVVGHFDSCDLPSHWHHFLGPLGLASANSVTTFQIWYMQYSSCTAKWFLCFMESNCSKSKGHRPRLLWLCSPLDSPSLYQITSGHRHCPNCLRCCHQRLGLHFILAIVVSVMRHRLSSPKLNCPSSHPAHSWQ